VVDFAGASRPMIGPRTPLVFREEGDELLAVLTSGGGGIHKRGLKVKVSQSLNNVH
jgi:hypothetical protein